MSINKYELKIILKIIKYINNILYKHSALQFLFDTVTKFNEFEGN